MAKMINSKQLKENMVYSQLKNGLDVYIFPKPGYSKQYAIYATKYGSNDTAFVIPGDKQPTLVPDGIAHFLEHKLFEEEHGNVFESYSKLGAQPNAFTNFNTTAYHFTSTDNFYDCLDVLVGFVGRPYFTAENVEKEKGIIAQEIKMYEDEPNWRVFFNMLGGLYQNHPVRRDIAGTVDSIQKIDKDLLYKCYNTFYHPSNMVLFIVGDVDHERIFKQLDGHFDNSLTKSEEIKRIYPDEPAQVNESMVKQKLAVSRPLFALGFKDIPLNEGGDKLLEKLIVNDILMDMFAGTSSQLYNKLYEEGLINDTFQWGYTGEKDYGYAMLTGETSDTGKVIDVIFDEVNKIKNSPFEQDYFMRIKKKKIGEFVRIFNSLEVIGYLFVSLYQKDISIFDYMNKLDSIAYSQVIDAFNSVIDIDKSTVSVVEPNK